MTHCPPKKVTCTTWVCVAGRITAVTSFDMTCRLCLKRRTFNFSLEGHLKCEFVSDQKVLWFLIICTIPAPQACGRAITLSSTNALYRAVSSQVAWVNSKNINREQKTEAWRSVEPGIGVVLCYWASPLHAAVFSFQGKLVNMASWPGLRRRARVYVYICEPVLCLLSRCVCAYIRMCVLWISCSQDMIHKMRCRANLQRLTK